MILRTPPPKRPRPDVKTAESPTAGSGRRLIIYEDSPLVVHPPESSQEPEKPAMNNRQQTEREEPVRNNIRQRDSYFDSEPKKVKADFMDALSSAEKQVFDYQTKLETLNGNFSTACASPERIKAFSFQDNCRCHFRHQ